jgi:DNA-binding NarL/FixJ family response regulator
MPPQRPFHVLLIGEDSSLSDALVRALEGEESIGSVRTTGQVRAHRSAPDPDVIVIDAGPPPPDAAAMAAWDATRKEALALVLASDASEQTQKLAEAVGAVAYLRKDSGAAAITPVVVALAAISSVQWPFA